MHMGSVAKRMGVTPDAIGFYERSGLWPRPLRTAGGFRQLERELRTALRDCDRRLRRRSGRCPLLSWSISQEPDCAK
jgi:DNA-binding transcriptional MerR regulator